MNPERTLIKQPKEINYKEKYLEILVKEKLPYCKANPKLYRGFLLPHSIYYQPELIDSIASIISEGFTIDEITIAAIRVFGLKDTYEEESNE